MVGLLYNGVFVCVCVCTLSGGGAWCTEGYLFECQLTVSLSKDTAMMRTTLLSVYLTMVFLGASLCTTGKKSLFHYYIT